MVLPLVFSTLLWAGAAPLPEETSPSWLSAERAQDLQGLIADVLSEGERQTNLQDSGAHGGWDKGFFLKSSDGAFSLKIGGQFQVRWSLNDAKGQATTWGFANRRTKLSFSGTVIDPSWSYKVKGAFGGSTGAFGLEDAFIAKRLDDGIEIKVGAFKAPWMREELVSSSKQLAADRSVVNNYFNQGYSKGVQVSAGKRSWRISAWIGDGLNTVALGYRGGRTSGWNTNATRWSVAGRLECRLSGEWSQFKDFSSRPGEEFGVMLGVGAMGQKFKPSAGTTFGAGTGAKQHGLTADVAVDFGGASLFAAAVWNHNDLGAVATNPWGVLVQGGWFASEDVELFGRVDYANFDLDGPMANGQVYQGLTLGLNYYLSGHALKFTVDWSMNLESFGAFAPGGLGWRSDVGSATDQWAIRAQMQLLF